MPTEDIIEYDLALLTEMDNQSLLLQLIARKDLERPHRENDLKASAARLQLDAVIRIICDKFAEMGLPKLVDAIQLVMIEAYADVNFAVLNETAEEGGDL